MTAAAGHNLTVERVADKHIEAQYVVNLVRMARATPGFDVRFLNVVSRSRINYRWRTLASSLLISDRTQRA